jgi:hypothetical protein
MNNYQNATARRDFVCLSRGEEVQGEEWVEKHVDDKLADQGCSVGTRVGGRMLFVSCVSVLHKGLLCLFL